MPIFTRRALGGVLISSIAPLGGQATATTPTAGHKPLLTVTGQISAPTTDRSATFDMATLEGLGLDGFETTTPWYSGPVRFDGVRMSRLMQEVGATGTSVRAVALNDYTTDVPISDFEKYGVILATKRDGAYMPVRDKGPLFIVYPYDSAPELKAQRYYSRSAWQVIRLVIE
jgi:hypothetical protein